MSIEFNGSTALVTGATGGIGQAIARALHGRGATVIVTGRRGDVLEQLRASWASGSRRWSPISPTGPPCSGSPSDTDVDLLVANAALPAAES